MIDMYVNLLNKLDKYIECNYRQDEITNLIHVINELETLLNLPIRTTH